MKLFQKHVELTVFWLTCLLAGGIAAVSWWLELLHSGACTPMMTVQCLLFFLLTSAASYPLKSGDSVFDKWNRWSRQSHWHFLLAPLFIRILCSLLRPYQLPADTEEWLWAAGAHVISYAFLLFILFLFGWDKNSPDMLKNKGNEK